MAQKIEALRGMDDILPGEVEKWQWLEEKARLFFHGFGFKEIRTPVLEYTDLFSRSIGEATDIVHKEMFSFEDRGERNITLRPEMTASVARAVIEKGLLSQAKSLRFFYIGPMFRAERPQAGRKRQFHQIGIEIINESGVVPDVDAVRYLYQFLTELGVQDLELRINDLGSREDQKKIAEKLREYFSANQSALCEDCRYRLEKNVLRVLDCKNPKCQPVVDKAPWEAIAPQSAGFEEVKKSLGAWNIPFQIKRRLVRGLDYYNGLVFEMAAKGLGAQDALAGGGRYDGLYSEIGGKPTPCIGFSIGMERLFMALGNTAEEKSRENVIYFAPVFTDEEWFQKQSPSFIINKAIYELGQLGMKPLQGERGLKMDNHLKAAIRNRAKYMVIFGAEELKNGEWTFKDMDNKTQEKIKHGSLFSRIKKVNV